MCVSWNPASLTCGMCGRNVINFEEMAAGLNKRRIIQRAVFQELCAVCGALLFDWLTYCVATRHWVTVCVVYFQNCIDEYMYVYVCMHVYLLLLHCVCMCS